MYLRVSPLFITADGLFMPMEEIHDSLDDFRSSITNPGKTAARIHRRNLRRSRNLKGRRDTEGIRDAEAGLVASYMPTNGGFCEGRLKCGFTPVISVWIGLKTCFFEFNLLDSRLSPTTTELTNQATARGPWLEKAKQFFDTPIHKSLQQAFQTPEKGSPASFGWWYLLYIIYFSRK